jgi:hypothetical protein
VTNKDTKNKLRPSLIPVEFTCEMLEVLEFGAQKYGVNNWQGETNIELFLDACERHIISYKKGYAVDDETGRHNLVQAATNLMFIFCLESKR